MAAEIVENKLKEVETLGGAYLYYGSVKTLNTNLWLIKHFLRTSEKREKDVRTDELTQEICDFVYKQVVILVIAYKTQLENATFSEQVENVSSKVTNICSHMRKFGIANLGINEEKFMGTSVRGIEYTNFEKNLYNDLPQHLQICFLYFGMFPPDFNISVSHLVCMWIAEGFIWKQEGLSLEETAQNYVEDLINRHLVVVGQYSLDGKVKTCRVHETLHDFCKIQAANENVVQEIKFKNGVFEPPISKLPLYHRLCIHSRVLDFLRSKPRGPSVRSLVSFSSDEVNLPSESNSTIFTAFELLRILDFKPIRFSHFPSDMYRLLHLRYVALSVLPAPFSKLSNLQTLIVDTTSRTLEDKANSILKFVQLRHFKKNEPVSLPRVSNSRQEAENLQTLGLICTEKNLGRAPNLKKLGIRGRLSLLMDGNKDSFDRVGRLAYLEKLKLLNYPSQDPVRNLPPGYKFPPSLRSLTLSSTYLDWSQMHFLGSLEELKVLKLKDNAFVGDTWVTGDGGGFRNLEGLHIRQTDLVIWVTSANHFPKLKHLELYNCEELKEVPIELADILSLQRLKLFRVDLAKRIHKRKHRKDIAFELSI